MLLQRIYTIGNASELEIREITEEERVSGYMNMCDNLNSDKIFEAYIILAGMDSVVMFENVNLQPYKSFREPAVEGRGRPHMSTGQIFPPRDSKGTCSPLVNENATDWLGPR